MLLDSLNDSMLTNEVISSEDLQYFLNNLVCDRCGERVYMCPMEFKDIYFKWASVYVALNVSRNEIGRDGLASIVPSRVTRNGRPPTVLSWETGRRWRVDGHGMLSTPLRSIQVIKRYTSKGH